MFKDIAKNRYKKKRKNTYIENNTTIVGIQSKFIFTYIYIYIYMCQILQDIKFL